MKLVNKGALRHFVERHADARAQVGAWEAEVLAANWKTPADIKHRYQHASFISGRRVIFNIKGGRYRLLVKVDFDEGVVIVQRVGTHEDYNGWEM